ncbi:hypothetical protein BJ508DRAFT_373165 [Ascobolus immersus RN42]|uniref:F-box domain-containing protein n=1 Tax=Ascobolus immersus RN42 TaxID=1160509 RepID=A0A3N4IIL4_ASCIM|nr:hypothetical protein BJ508DRAFT_373165 [Ascobolus immersus RN42]
MSDPDTPGPMPPQNPAKATSDSDTPETMPPQDPAEAWPTTFTLLSLPVEMRLEIYRQCSALTLLVLAATAKSLRSEILQNPAICRQAFGYTANPGDWWPESDGSNVSTFSIRNIATVPSADDRTFLYKKLLRWDPPDSFIPVRTSAAHRAPLLGKNYGCCVGCLDVVGLGEFDRKKIVEESGQTEFKDQDWDWGPWGWADYCTGCWMDDKVPVSRPVGWGIASSNLSRGERRWGAYLARLDEEWQSMMMNMMMNESGLNAE